jgi:hypothetical protein
MPIIERLILAVDPGKTTGYGLLFVDDKGKLDSVSFNQLTMDDFLPAAAEMIEDWGSRTTVVCESFTVTQRTTKQRGERLWSVEQIGVLRWLTTRALGSYLEQSPSDAKSFATDKKLKSIGWYTVGMEHARDAARHALLYCVRGNLVDPRLLMEV